MARTWYLVQVELVRGPGVVCEPPPGRIFAVGPAHTFEQLAVAINAGFARWDLAHLHEFELADGRRIGYPGDENEPDPKLHDHASLKVVRVVQPGDEFLYTFDFGDNWEHRCRVEEQKIDPAQEFGQTPRVPTALWGWGSIPDQYGRNSRDGLDA
jgi:Plasmid pRiA4b ORF-3-like protein